MTSTRHLEDLYPIAGFDVGGEAFCRFTPDGILTFANETFCRCLGKSLQKLVGSNFLLALPQENRRSVRRCLDRLSLEHPVATRIHASPFADWRWQQWTYYAVAGDRGTIVAFQAVGRNIGLAGEAIDVASLEELEESARESTGESAGEHSALCQTCALEPWDRMAAYAPAGIFQTDPTGAIVSANPLWCEMAGISLRDVRGRNWLEAVLPDDRRRARHQWERGSCLEFRLRSPSGRVVKAIGQSSLLQDEQGNLKGRLGVLLDARDRDASSGTESPERWQLAARGSHDGIWDWDLQTNELFLCPRWKEMLGYRDEEIAPRFEEWWQRVHSEDLERMLQGLQEHLAGQTPSYTSEHRLRDRQGKYRWFLVRGRVLRDENGQRLRLAGSCTDITDRKKAETDLQKQLEWERVKNAIDRSVLKSQKLEDVLQVAVEQTRTFLKCDRAVVLHLDAEGDRGICSTGARGDRASLLRGVGARGRHVSFPYDRLPAKNRGASPTKPPAESALAASLGARASLSVPIFTGDAIARDRACHTRSDRLWGLLVALQDGEPRAWEAAEAKFLKQIATQVGFAMQQFQLYDRLQRSNQELLRLVKSDCLTGVANRRHFDEYLRDEWRRGVREQRPFSLLLCDIDFFKAYNDNYGHPAGDACLKKVAAVLQQCVRSPADLVARYGGEEFAIVLPNTDLKEASDLAEKIRFTLQQHQIPHCGSSVAPWVTVSIGLTTTIPRADLSEEVAIAEADGALYAAKQRGRDRVARTACGVDAYC